MSYFEIKKQGEIACVYTPACVLFRIVQDFPTFCLEKLRDPVSKFTKHIFDFLIFPFFN